MDYQIKQEKKFRYIEKGKGKILLLFHGLFGALSNFIPLIEEFSKRYKVVIPLLPLYELPLFDATLQGLTKHVIKFVKHKKYDSVIALGNSLGGHIGLIFTLKKPEIVKSLILTGSSGLFENAMGGSFPKRGDYNFIKEKTQYTFYDPKVATKELVDEIFEIVNNRAKAIRVISTAKSAIRTNMSKKLPRIKCPTLLIWGKEDKITPPFVAEEFKTLIPNSELKFIEKCGHAPMMERPKKFNIILDEFLKNIEH